MAPGSVDSSAAAFADLERDDATPPAPLEWAPPARVAPVDLELLGPRSAPVAAAWYVVLLRGS